MQAKFPSRERVRLSDIAASQRVPFWDPVPWELDGNATADNSSTYQIEIVGDNKTVTNCVAEVWVPTKRSLVELTESCLHTLQAWYVQKLAVPRQPWAPWTRHIYRAQNTDADALSRTYRNNLTVHKPIRLWAPDFRAIRGSFDGSVQGNNVGYGWVIYVNAEPAL